MSIIWTKTHVNYHITHTKRRYTGYDCPRISKDNSELRLKKCWSTQSTENTKNASQ